jgi:hypothetical protein
MNRSPLHALGPIAATPETDPTEVRGQDVERIGVLQELLMTLNDPAASARAIAQHVEQYPVLRARIAVRYRQRYGDRALPRTSAQIATLGNRELEGILLQLLEDIVTFHSERSAVSG